MGFPDTLDYIFILFVFWFEGCGIIDRRRGAKINGVELMIMLKPLLKLLGEFSLF